MPRPKRPACLPEPPKGVSGIRAGGGSSYVSPFRKNGTSGARGGSNASGGSSVGKSFNRPSPGVAGRAGAGANKFYSP